MAYAVRADWDGFLGDIETSTTVQNDAIDVAAATMNGVFRSVLIETVPIDLTEFDAGDDKTELTIWLQLVNLRLAAEHLTVGKGGAGKKISTDAQWARDQLKEVQSERFQLALVTYKNVIDEGHYLRV